MGPRYCFERVESTQALARAHAQRFGAQPATFVATRQDRGVGRLDHTWASPEGGLYLSAVTRVPPVRPELVTLGVAASLGQSLRTRFDVPLGLRWPNDLVVASPSGSRKLAGVLVDRVDGPAGSALAVGVGVNVVGGPESLPPALRASSVFLSDLTRASPSPAEVEPLVVAAIDRTIARLRSEEEARRVVAECRALLVGIDRPVWVDGSPSGTARALGDDGALWVEVGEEWRPIRAGSVNFEASA